MNHGLRGRTIAQSMSHGHGSMCSKLRGSFLDTTWLWRMASPVVHKKNGAKWWGIIQGNQAPSMARNQSRRICKRWKSMTMRATPRKSRLQAILTEIVARDNRVLLSHQQLSALCSKNRCYYHYGQQTLPHSCLSVIRTCRGLRIRELAHVQNADVRCRLTWPLYALQAAPCYAYSRLWSFVSTQHVDFNLSSLKYSCI